MRIVSGIYGGRRLQVPKGRDIRPTSDKVRGAIFNALESRGAVEGVAVMDCFCGTGALGLEALSRGAMQCLFIDKARSSLDLAKDNVRDLGAGEQAEFLLKDVGRIGERPDGAVQAGLVFMDPPYGHGLAVSALEALLAGGWIADDGLIVIEEDKGFVWPGDERLRVFDERVYKDTKVLYLRHCEEDC